jgi:2-polyprenyl-3-methyl-5-hydroxy-6-metoxy-1,4-benzoquinol methylase
MTDNTAHIAALAEAVITINNLQRSFLETSICKMDEDETQALEAYLDYCISTGHEIGYIAKCYDLIVKDTLREQLFFQRHKHYRYSSYDDVAHSVYLNDDYMDMYMHGLAVTSFLWPNHREMRRFFLKTMPRDVSGRYLEVGPGHGIYFMSAMQHTEYNSFEGVDISPKSVELTRNILGSGYFGISKNFSLCCRNFLEQDMPHREYAAIVMGEVLEHVENPLDFLEKIHVLAARDSFIYITTCINAPAIDHIYLFDSLESLDEIIQCANLVIRERLIVPYEGMSLDESVEQRMPINVAYVLGK